MKVRTYKWCYIHEVHIIKFKQVQLVIWAPREIHQYRHHATLLTYINSYSCKISWYVCALKIQPHLISRMLDAPSDCNVVCNMPAHTLHPINKMCLYRSCIFMGSTVKSRSMACRLVFSQTITATYLMNFPEHVQQPLPRKSFNQRSHSPKRVDAPAVVSFTGPDDQMLDYQGSRHGNCSQYLNI